jgi:hypothetical protein
MPVFHRSTTFRRCPVYQLIAAGMCAFAFALLLGGAIPVQTAHAEGGTAAFSIRPAAPHSTTAAAVPYFVLSLKPGASVQSTVRVTNTGTARGNVALYPVDATTGQTSGIVYLSHRAPRSDVGAWMTVTAPQLTLNPGQSQTVAFTVVVPSGVRPGQHVGGLVAENLAVQSASNNNVQISIQHLSIVAVQVNVPGLQSQHLEATSIQAGGAHNYQILFVTLHNVGTQMMKPSGTLQVTDMAGHSLKKEKLTLDTLLPQTTIDYPVYLDGQALGPGHYKAVLSLTYGDPQQTLQRTFDFKITAADLIQVFGNRSPNTPPVSAAAGSNGVLSILAIAGAVALLLLVGFGASIIFVPALRPRLLARKR